jgi:transcriptional regulator with XRE-family HTH domain
MAASPFGFLLRTIREETRLSLRELSDLSKVDHTYIFRLETGDKESPSEEVVNKLLKVLKPDQRRAELLRYLAQHPQADLQLVEYAAKEPTVSLELFSAAAAISYRGAGRPDPATRIERIRKIIQAERDG